MLAKILRVVSPQTMLTLSPDLWDQNELYEPYSAPPSGEDTTRSPDLWNLAAAYEPYKPAPTGFDASRFPDRSGGLNDLY
mmetsp:Transcript_65748/g.176176  ORF Transcript_65748/g.176176 Transcript_65748/m.176176 type:complete len:80 (+) Transcript_65748:224-463(+)